MDKNKTCCDMLNDVKFIEWAKIITKNAILIQFNFYLKAMIVSSVFFFNCKNILLRRKWCITSQNTFQFKEIF